MAKRHSDPEVSAFKMDFKQMIDEIRHFRRLSDGFLDPRSSNVLQEYEDTFHAAISSKADQEVCCGISRVQPLRTKVSQEWGRNAEINPVYAALSGQWNITTENRVKGNCMLFKFTGLCSTLVEIRIAGENEDAKPIHRWHIDIANPDQEGAHVHMQVKRGEDPPPYPEWLEIPRFPSLMFTPLSILEFVLAELFPESWVRHIADAPNRSKWADVQSSRLSKLLAWMQEVVGAKGSTPCINLRAHRIAETQLVANR